MTIWSKLESPGFLIGTLFEERIEPVYIPGPVSHERDEGECVKDK